MTAAMKEQGLFAGRRALARAMAVLGLAGPAALGGCVTINAPEKPIVINLNINISQEVVLKLDGQAKSLIQDNPGVF